MIKKLLAFIFVLFIIPIPTALAYEAPVIDWSALSTDEINAITDAAYHELVNRQVDEDGYTVLGENEHIKVLMTHAAEFDDQNGIMYLEAIFVNKTKEDIQISPKYISVDGWDCTVEVTDLIEVTANKMRRGDIIVRYCDAGYSSYTEIGELEFSFLAYQNFATWSPKSVTDPCVYISQVSS